MGTTIKFWKIFFQYFWHVKFIWIHYLIWWCNSSAKLLYILWSNVISFLSRRLACRFVQRVIGIISISISFLLFMFLSSDWTKLNISWWKFKLSAIFFYSTLCGFSLVPSSGCLNFLSSSHLFSSISRATLFLCKSKLLRWENPVFLEALVRTVWIKWTSRIRDVDSVVLSSTIFSKSIWPYVVEWKVLTHACRVLHRRRFFHIVIRSVSPKCFVLLVIKFKIDK